jgi:hypothetical protein
MKSKLLCKYSSSLDLHENVAKRWCHQTIGDEMFPFVQLWWANLITLPKTPDIGKTL